MSPTRREFLKVGISAAVLPAGYLTSRTVSAGPYDPAHLVDGPPPSPTKNSWSIAVLPDTQNYSDKYPDQFMAQTNWIVAERSRRNIQFVLHLGDFVNHPTEREWGNAIKAMQRLDGQLPYFMVPGNHDYEGDGRSRTTRFSEYFPVSKFRTQQSFGGVYDKEPDRYENNFHLISAGGRDLLILCLEFGPRRDVVRWANDVVGSHKGRQAIFITHAYMYYDDTRYDWAKLGRQQRWNPHAYAPPGGVTDGQQLWDMLVAKHDNFLFTINGHVLSDGLGRLRSTTTKGNDVMQMLVNFQMKPNGGDGWLRILEFQPDGTTVHVVDYSPTRNQVNISPQNSFKFQLPS
jgi:predicted phosphodiesterase